MGGDQVTAFVDQNEAVVRGQDRECKQWRFERAEQDDCSDKRHGPMKKSLYSVDPHNFDEFVRLG